MMNDMMKMNSEFRRYGYVNVSHQMDMNVVMYPEITGG
jgi:hypothetical protein